jgi:hypothetical protein
MKIGDLVKTNGIDRAIVTALGIDGLIQIDNDPDWIEASEYTIIGEATAQDWLALVMLKHTIIERHEKKLGEYIMQQGRFNRDLDALKQQIAKQDRQLLEAENNGRLIMQKQVDDLEKRLSATEKTLHETITANNQARAKLAVFENEVKPGDPDLKIITFYDDPILRESTLQVERHLSEGARLLDLTVVPITSILDGQPQTRVCRIFTLQKRVKPAPTPRTQPHHTTILTQDFVAENLPVTAHIREHGAADALDLMDAAAASRIKARINESLTQFTYRPLLPANIQ